MKLTRLGAGAAFDAAVIAWDLHPEWNELGTFCRWNETVHLFTLLGESDSLPASWKQRAAERAEGYRNRARPADRLSSPVLQNGDILPLCMEPEFESILTYDERAARIALEVTGRASGWPGGWGPGGSRRPAEEVMRPAVDCVPRSAPVRRMIRGNWRTAKNEWGEYVLRTIANDPRFRQSLAEHPIVNRLCEVCPA